jgi:hypothetical protein
MCILLQFNEKQSFTLAELSEKMKFDEKVMQKCLREFFDSKQKLKKNILTQSPEGLISVNIDFYSPIKRLFYKPPILEESYKREKITEDRGHSVEAQIVRIMKSRK